MTLLLDPNDCYGLNMSLFLFYAKFTASKQKGGVVFLSVAVLIIVKTTEIIFTRKFIENDIGISKEKHLDQEIQNSVFEHIGLAHFRNSLPHFYNHTVEERDHLSSLLQTVTKRYVDLCLKSYGKKFSEMVVHKNITSSRHILTKKISFSNL